MQNGDAMQKMFKMLVYSCKKLVLTPTHNGFTQTAQSLPKLGQMPKLSFSGPS
jgi:hypothetical protein